MYIYSTYAPIAWICALRMNNMRVILKTCADLDTFIIQLFRSRRFRVVVVNILRYSEYFQNLQRNKRSHPTTMRKTHSLDQCRHTRLENGHVMDTGIFVLSKLCNNFCSRYSLASFPGSSRCERKSEGKNLVKFITCDTS